MSENGDIYTAGKKFTLPPAVTAVTNLTSVLDPNFQKPELHKNAWYFSVFVHSFNEWWFSILVALAPRQNCNMTKAIATALNEHMTQPTKRKHVLKMQDWFELISSNSSWQLMFRFVQTESPLLLCKTWRSSSSPFSPPSLISKYLNGYLVSKLNALSTCRMRHKHVSLGLFSKLTNQNFWTVRCHWCFWTDRWHVENN